MKSSVIPDTDPLLIHLQYKSHRDQMIPPAMFIHQIHHAPHLPPSYHNILSIPGIARNLAVIPLPLHCQPRFTAITDQSSEIFPSRHPLNQSPRANHSKSLYILLKRETTDSRNCADHIPVARQGIKFREIIVHNQMSKTEIGFTLCSGFRRLGMGRSADARGASVLPWPGRAALSPPFPSMNIPR